MAKKPPFSLVFAPAVKQHLKAIEAKWDGLIRRKIEEQPPAFRRRGVGFMKTASAEEVGAQFDAYLRVTVKEPVVVTRNAKPVAVLLSVKNPDEFERFAMSQSKKLRRILQISQRQISAGRGIPQEEFWRQVEQMRKR